jgi:hypothetical protein
MSGVSHLKKAGQWLKTCEDYTFSRKVMISVLFGLSRRFSHRFSDNNEPSTRLLFEASYRLNKTRISFKTTKSTNQKRLLHEKARSYTVVVTAGTLEEVHCEALPRDPAQSSDLVQRNFHLFDPLKEALGGKGFRADDVKIYMRRWLDEQRQTCL